MCFCSDDIIETVIRRGGYTKEVIGKYEMESYFVYILRRPSKSNALWQKPLRLRDLPMDTPIFNNVLPEKKKKKADNDINFFREYDRQALLCVRTILSPRHKLSWRATAIALRFVNVRQNFLEIYERFSKFLHSLNCKNFFYKPIHMLNIFLEIIAPFSQKKQHR